MAEVLLHCSGRFGCLQSDERRWGGVERLPSTDSTAIVSTASGRHLSSDSAPSRYVCNMQDGRRHRVLDDVQQWRIW